MSDGFVCDRCDKPTRGTPTATIDQTLEGEMDVCEACAIDFKRWANKKPKNPLESMMERHE